MSTTHILEQVTNDLSAAFSVDVVFDGTKVVDSGIFMAKTSAGHPVARLAAAQAYLASLMVALSDAQTALADIAPLVKEHSKDLK